MGCSKLTHAFGPRKNFLGILLPVKSKQQKNSFINLALKLTQPLFNPKSSLSKHSPDSEYSSIRTTIAFEKSTMYYYYCYAKPVYYYLSPFMIGLHITITTQCLVI